MKLLELPQPDYAPIGHSYYSKVSVRAIQIAAARAALTEAAKVCEEIENGTLPDGGHAAGLSWECLDAIRAIKIEGEPNG